MSDVHLWQEVLLRAITDARLAPDAAAFSPRQVDEINEARAYLTMPSKDLAAVCAMAGVDMEAMIERMNRRIAEAGPLRTRTESKPDQQKKRNQNVLYEFEGRQLSVKQLSEISGVSAYLIYTRIRKGWSLDAATNPIKIQGQRPKRIDANSRYQKLPSAA